MHSRQFYRLAALFSLMLAILGGPVVAQSDDFTFKRIKVDQKRSGPRINIQIEPTPEPEPESFSALIGEEEPVVETIETKPAPNLQDWFWGGVSPKIDKADFKRMDFALAQLQTATDQSARIQPSRGTMEKLIQKYGKEILLASLDKSVSPAFVLSVIAVESGGKVDAESSKGAQGLMQLIPATAERFNVKDVNDPLQNITAGTSYLEWLLSEFRHDPLLALAGYNAGENAVKKYNGVPPYAETRAYVPKVVAAWGVARHLCKTVPTLVSDPCVFNLK